MKIKKIKHKLIECIQLDDKNGDGPYLWRLDVKNNGNNFFLFLKNNYEADSPTGEISVVHLTEKQWKKAVKLGKELA